MRSIARLSVFAQLCLYATHANAEEQISTLRTEIKGVEIKVPVQALVRGEAVSNYAIDRDATQTDSGNVSPLFRIGLSADTGKAILPFILHADYEHDLLTGTLVGKNDPTLGNYFPRSEALDQNLRKAFLRASLGWFAHVGGGLTTSEFGMGMVANGASRLWDRNSKTFQDPRGGDRVIRGVLATGPHGNQKWFAAVAVDHVVDDDFLVKGQDDGATQFVGMVTYNRDQPTEVGAYFVRRDQTALNGRSLNVQIADVYGRTEFSLGDGAGRLRLESETAFIFGSTSIAGTAAFPKQDVLQLGSAIRAHWQMPTFGAYFDAFYGTGDANFNDNKQTRFNADPNFSYGMLMFTHVMQAQTARTSVYGGDPTLVGTAPPGLERFSTRGSMAGSLALFPRGYVQFLKNFEVYGGPLIGISTAAFADPFNTQIASDRRNALNGAVGSFLGTEFDLGLGYRESFQDSELRAAFEAAAFLPGNAFQNAFGQNSNAIFGGRLMLSYRL